MGATPEQLLNVILDDSSGDGERSNAVSLLKKLTGKDRAALVAEYLKPKAKRSSSKKTKADLEEELTAVNRYALLLRQQLEAQQKKPHIVVKNYHVSPVVKIITYTVISALAYYQLIGLMGSVLLVLLATCLIWSAELKKVQS